MFCPELQKLLKPIYDLTRKGRPFIWGKEQQDSFEEIKCRLIKNPCLAHAQLKPAIIRMSQCNVQTLAQLRKIMNTNLILNQNL